MDGNDTDTRNLQICSGAKLNNEMYKVIRKLGTGSFCTVWLCKDEINTTKVAIKICTNDSSHMAKDEIGFFKSINNADSSDRKKENILSFLNEFHIKEHICMVFKEVADCDIYDIMAQYTEGIPLQFVQIIIRQLLQGLDYLHNKCKIIHFDIKPENILCIFPEEVDSLLDVEQLKNIRIKIADFGLATRINSSPREGDSYIHLYSCYTSIEVIIGANYSTKTDIWNTACLAFKLAAGKHIFDVYQYKNKFPTCSTREAHVACIIQILGHIPKTIALSGIHSYELFNQNGKLRKFPRISVFPKGLFSILREQNEFDEEFYQFVNLLNFMLNYDEKIRFTAAQCLMHTWIQENN